MARQVAQRYLVFPKLPTSLENKITILYPPTETLALHFAIEGLWVLPSHIDMDRWNSALAEALSIFSPVAGRLCAYPDTESDRGDTYIQLTNSAIPVTVVDDFETRKFPFRDVVMPQEEAEPWFDRLAPALVNCDEPLFRVQFTRLHKTSETVMTGAWSHALGDGFSVHLFVSYISHIYRGADTSHLVRPSFDKVFFPPPPLDPSIWNDIKPLIKHLDNALSPAEMFELYTQSLARTTPINITLSPNQLQALADRASATKSAKKVSRITAFVSYLVHTYNATVAEAYPEQELLDTVVNTIDYRGDPKFASRGMIGNAAITIQCPSFTPTPVPREASAVTLQKDFEASLAAIASSIQTGNQRSRDPAFLDHYLRFHSALCRKCYKNHLLQNLFPASPREISFNSSYVLNWRKAGDLFESPSEYAEARKTRFHTTALMENYIRIFPTNPIPPAEHGNPDWDFELDGGAEAAFMIKKELATPFKEKIRKDMESNFSFIVSTRM